jgi:hypothetical protein
LRIINETLSNKLRFTAIQSKISGWRLPHRIKRWEQNSRKEMISQTAGNLQNQSGYTSKRPEFRYSNARGESALVLHTKLKLSQTKIIKPFQLQRLERG